MTCSTPATPILILAHAHPAITAACIASIQQHTQAPHRILLIDNGASPPFPTSDDYSLLRLPQNLYYTRGINAGIQEALRLWPDSEDLVLLNNDTEVLPGWLQALRQHRDHDIGIVGNKHLAMQQKQRILHLGTVDLLGGMHKGGIDRGEPQPVSEEVWVSFACVLIRRRCLNAIGLLDERMQHYFSDNDYCLRAQMAGFRVICEPQSAILHHHSYSYQRAAIDLTADQQIYIDKWLGKDLRERIFYRSFLYAQSRQMLDLKSHVLQSPQAQPTASE